MKIKKSQLYSENFVPTWFSITFCWNEAGFKKICSIVKPVNSSFLKWTVKNKFVGALIELKIVKFLDVNIMIGGQGVLFFLDNVASIL